MFVYINAFWAGFTERTDGVHWGFFENILERVFDCKIHITGSLADADILLESYFGSSVLQHKSWKYSIFFSGEAHDIPFAQSYTFCMGARDSGENFISCPLYLAYDYCKPFSYPRHITSVPPNGVCSIISSEIPGRYRYTLLDILREKGIHIDNAGCYRNTLGYTIPGSYSDPPIIEFEQKYKIVLAFENAELDDYITEKILNAFRAGTIPVYFGSKQISKYFNPKRFIQVGSIEETVKEVQQLLSDPSYWLEKVNEPIFIQSTKERIESIIQLMKRMSRTYAVEIICNREKEPERLQTLQPVIDYFKVEPVCSVWGEEARGHELFSTFRQGININAISLAINHIELLRSHMKHDCYLLVLESDVIPIYDIEYVDNQIEKTIKEMKEHSIDFCFLGEGCFGKMTPPHFRVHMHKCSDTLYACKSSRCTEAYIVSPRGIDSFLKFIQTFNNTVIDFTYSFFFEQTGIYSSWRIPELFRQGSHIGIYKGNVPGSIL